MTKEEKLALLKESGLTVLGDFVLEKKVEYKIANVEPGGIGVQVNHGVQTVDNGAKKPAGADSRPKQGHSRW